jgi:hypothetical protein
MPVINGFRLAECIRAIETQFGARIAKHGEIGEIKSKLYSSYILIVTANLDADIQMEGMKFVNQLKFKPLTLDDFKKVEKDQLKSRNKPKKYEKALKNKV